jgi:DNA polymerase III delta subunit
MLYALGQATITADDVKAVMAAPPDLAEDFGIANAIREGDTPAALRQLAAALDAGAQPFFLLGQIRSAAEQAPSARIRESIEAVFRTDLALKSSGGDPRILLERLVVELSSMGGGGRSGRSYAPRR